MLVNRKRALCIFALVLVFACIFTVGALAADGAVCITDSDANGMSFTGSEMLHPGKALDEMPRTYEAVVKLPAGTSGESTIFGNYINLSTPHINFLIKSTGKPAIYMHDTATKDARQTKIEFNSIVTGDAWAHVVITHESNANGDVFTCYVNGEMIESKSASFAYGEMDMDYMQSISSFHFGQDFRYESKNAFFKGEIKDFALYSEALTAAQIKENYENGISSSNDSLILYYDLENKATATEVADSSGNGYTLKPIYYEEENEPTDYDFSFAVIGDTQKLVNYDTTNNTKYTQAIFDWIKANASDKKIARVFGVGDITETPENSDGSVDEAQEELEWLYAEQLYRILSNSDIPYTVTWGLGHDRPAKFDYYFADEENFTSSAKGQYTEMGCYTEGSIKNYYQRFTVGNTSYTVLSLEYKHITDDIFSWADGIIKANPNDKVIILSHYFLELEANIPEANQAMWDRLVTNNKNVILTLSGHVNYPANIVRTQREGDAGHTVTQLLINPQYMDAEYGYDKTSFVAMLYFSEGGSKVDVRYVSTVKSNESDTDILYSAVNQFSFEIPAPKTVISTKYGIIPTDYSDAELYPFVLFDGAGNFVGAAPYFLGEKKADSAIGLAKAYLASNKWDKDNERFVGPNDSKALEIYVLVRRDVAMASGEYYNDFSQIQGTVVIDLNDKTLTTPVGKSLYNTALKAWNDSGDGDEAIFPSTITMLNGNINITNRELIQLSVTSNGADKIFIFNFENIDFKVLGTSQNFMARHNTASDSDYNSNLPSLVNFIDCNIDLSVAGNSVKIFNLSDGKTKINACIKGGSIITGEASYNLYTNVNNSGSLRFEESLLGDYTTILTKENAPTSDKFGNLYFKTLSNADGVTTYAPVMVASYGNISYEIPYQYLSVKNYPFIVIDDAGLAPVGTDKFSSALNSAKTNMKNKNAKLWNGTDYGNNAVSSIVIMRRDYTLQSGEVFSNISQFMGEVIIDLGGFTLAANKDNEESIFNGTLKIWREQDSGIAGGVFDTVITVNNGNIVIYNKALVSFSTSNATGKNLTYNFNGINLQAKGDKAVAIACGSSSNVSYAKANFTDCTFDYTEAGTLTTNINLFHAGTSYTNTEITVKGGSIIMGAKKFVLKTGGDSGTGYLSFEKNDSGEYTTLYTSNSFSGNAALVNDGKLTFVKQGTTSAYTLVPTASLNLGFAPKASITLDSNLIFNIYIPDHAGLTSATLNGTPVALENADGGYFLVSTELSAEEGAKTLTLVVTLEADGTELKGTFTFSTVKYVQKLITTEATEIEKTLAKDMLAYVKSAYNYFDSADKATVADEIDAVIGNYSKTFAKVEGAGADADDIIAGATLVLDSTPAIRFYISSYFDSADYVFSVNGKAIACEFKQEDANNEYNTLYYTDISLYAYQMVEEITITCGSSSANYHINAYYDSVDKSDAELVDIVTKFYNYCVSASAYRNSVINK